MDKQVPATKKFSPRVEYINLVAFDSIFPDFIPSEVLWFIGCQFALESNFGHSSLAVIRNNHCGMKSPLKRITFAIDPKPNMFASYASLSDCIADYLLWLVSNNFSQACMSDLSLFKAKLRISGYCPEKGYIEKIEKIFNETYLNIL